MTDPGLPAVDVGDVVGGYRIEGVIGVGAMGTVFRARQLRLDRVVALKVIAAGLADDEGARRRFAREARLAVRVVHPHVVSVLDAGEDRGTLFMAMELVDGVDLATLLATEGPLVAWRAVAIVEQLAAALDHAHDLGLVHRDVKPANVLLVTRGDSDHAYLTDFGLAKALRPSSVSDSVVDDVASGTPDYMAPEVLDGGAVDGRADVYALGGLLFAALTARAPYERDTIQATLAAHRHHAPPSLDAAGADSDANRLQPVIDRAMAKRPGDRHQSARGLADHARLETGAKPSRPATSDGRSGMWGSDDLPRSPTRRRRPFATRMSPFLPMLVRVTLILGMVGVWLTTDSGGGRTTLRTTIAMEKLASSQGFWGSARWGRTYGSQDLRVWLGSTRRPAGCAVRSTSSVRRETSPSPTGWLQPGSFSTPSPRVDAATGSLLGLSPLADRADHLAADDGVIWAVSSDAVALVDARSGVVRAGPSSARETYDVVIHKGVAWLAGKDAVRRYDVRSAKRRGALIDVGVSTLAAGDGGVWGADGSDVMRLDGGVRKRIKLAIEPGEMAVSAGLFWVVDQLEGDLAILDATTGQVLAPRVKVASKIGSITAHRSGVWIADYAKSELIRMTATRVRRSAR